VASKLDSCKKKKNQSEERLPQILKYPTKQL